MMRNSSVIPLFCLAMAATWVNAEERAGPRSENVAYFRHDGGVAGDARSLPADLANQARLVWRTKLDPGISTPCVIGDSVYVTAFQPADKELTTLALDRETGSLRWRQVCPAERLEPFHQTGSPASSSPASDGERVYSFFGSYGLLCYDRNGQLQWSKPMGPFQDEFGAASSPVLVDDKVILNEDHDVDSFLLAIDKRSGEECWKASRAGFVRSYSTPGVLRVGDLTQIVVAGSLQLAGYDPATGEKLWWINGLSRIVDSTPSILGDRVFMATWTPGGDEGERISMEPYQEALAKYDQNQDGVVAKSELPEGDVLTRFFRMDLNQDSHLDADEWAQHARVFELAQNVAMSARPDGEGDITERSVQWQYRRSLPTVPSSVVYDGVLYMVKDGGIITSLDADTGEMLKQGRAAGPGNYYASLIAGDGKVYLCSERGVVTVLAAGPDWEILSSYDFGERIMATPVVSEGRMYFRTDEALYCFE
jgi:outer membrane protein assembly factor BamB